MNEFNQNNENIESTEIVAENTKQKKSLGREIAEWVCSIAIALVIALVLRNYVVILAKVDGNSMLPTLHNNERLVVWRLGYKAEAGDIVILDPPSGRGPYVKRIIATGGQTVKIDNATGDVYVDGKKLEEPYINDKTYTMHGEGEFKVPEGHAFVMGDNRGNSHESRSADVSYIAEDKIYGEVVLRIWPLNTFGGVK